MLKDNLGLLLKHLSVSIDKIANNYLKDDGLTLTQVRVITFLMARKELTTSFSDVENFLHVAHTTVIGIIKRLEGNGFIIVEQSCDDKRVRNITLTEKHKDVTTILDNMQCKLFNILTSNLTEKEIITTQNCLCVMMENLMSADTDNM